MRSLLQISLVLLFGHTTLADLILMQPRSPIPQLQSLNRRQFCPYSLAICSSFNGDAVCQDLDEVCCQLIDGTTPYTCPIDFPWCCPSASDGTPLCGSTADCSGSLNNAPVASVKPTATAGTSVKASNGATGAVTATAPPTATQTVVAKGGAGHVEQVGWGLGVAIGVAVLL